MIELKNLTIAYKNFVAVNDISLKINEGEFFTMLGPSGCGKTTTLRAIAGFNKVKSGQILVNGSDFTNLEPEDRKIGFVFQNYALFPHLTVYENIAFGLKLKKFSKADIDEKVKHYADLIEIGGQLEKNVSNLSGGQQQRVAIARSLAMEPNILLMDEPLSNLDAKLRLNMRSEIKTLHKKLGITSVYVTHDQEEAMVMSDRIGVFNKGKLEQVGSPSELYQHPKNEFVCNFIGDTNLIPEQLVGEFNLDMRVGKKGRMYIRPEELFLSDTVPESDRFVAIDCKISEYEYMGKMVRYICEHGESKLSVLSLNRQLEVGKNRQAYICIDTNCVEVYKDDTI